MASKLSEISFAAILNFWIFLFKLSPDILDQIATNSLNMQ